jgi:hypothetical protein
MKLLSAPPASTMMRTSALLLLFTPLAACGGDEPASGSGFPIEVNDPVADPTEVGYSESRLVFETRAVDLGEILQHEEHPLVFPFRVEGEQPLVITEAAPSCGCTNVRIEVEGQGYVLGEPIPAGASGQVVGRFESGTFKELKKTDITLRGNGLDMPIRLDVQAMISPIFELTPKQVLFGEVPARRGAEREVLVSAVEPFTVERWVSSPSGFFIEPVGEAQPAPDGKRVLQRFRVELLPAAETRRHYGSFVGETSLGRRIEVVIQANVFGPVRYQPDQRVTFGMVDVGQELKRRVQVRSATGEAIPAPQVEVLDSELFTAEVTETEPGMAFVVQLRLSGEAGIGTHAARLRITYPESAQLDPQELAVSAIVRDRR